MERAPKEEGGTAAEVEPKRISLVRPPKEEGGSRAAEHIEVEEREEGRRAAEEERERRLAVEGTGRFLLRTPTSLE